MPLLGVAAAKSAAAMPTMLIALAAGGQDDDPEVTEVPPPPAPDVEYGSENEGQLPWEDKMVKAMQRDISAVLQ